MIGIPGWGISADQIAAMAASAAEMRLAYEAEQKRRAAEAPIENVKSPTELVGLFREMGWWDRPEESVEDFWIRVKATASDQLESLLGISVSRQQSASPFDPEPLGQAICPPVPPGGAEPDLVLG
jgi:hypothetical protein